MIWWKWSRGYKVREKFFRETMCFPEIWSCSFFLSLSIFDTIYNWCPTIALFSFQPFCNLHLILQHQLSWHPHRLLLLPLMRTPPSIQDNIFGISHLHIPSAASTVDEKTSIKTTSSESVILTSPSSAASNLDDNISIKKTSSTR